MSDLTQIALNDLDWKVRCDAVERITDEDILKEIFANDSIIMVRIAAMRRIGDADFLLDECQNNPQGHIRQAILSHILDERLLEEERLNSLLANIALRDPEDLISLDACENLSSDYQDVFVNVSKSKRDEKLRCKAISRITDENALNDFALNGESEFIRLEAIRNPNLANVNVLARIIEKDESEFNRAMAIMNIPDCKSLLEIVFDRPIYPRLAEIAANISFSPEDHFMSILENDDDPYRRIVAVSFIKNPDILECIALNSVDDKLICEAIKNPGFKNQKILQDFIENDGLKSIVREAMDKIEDENILIDYVNGHLTADDLTVRAISRISDLEFLDEIYSNPQLQHHAAKRMIMLKHNLDLIAADNPNREIRLEAVKAMSDKYELAKIAVSSQDCDIAMAALDNIVADRIINAYLPRRFTSPKDIEFKSRIWSLATGCEDKEIRKMAISKLSEKDVLDEIISAENDDEVVSAAKSRLNTLFEDIKLINDEEVLRAIGQNGDEDIESAVHAKIEDLRTWKDRIAEIDCMTDVDMLKDIAINDYNYLVRCEAEGKLESLIFNVRLDEINLKENQDRFRQIANDDSFPLEIRKKAMKFIRLT